MRQLEWQWLNRSENSTIAEEKEEEEVFLMWLHDERYCRNYRYSIVCDRYKLCLF